MAYGPLTKGHLSRLSRGEIYSEAGTWRPDAYTLPFPDRLGEFVESYFDLLPPDPVRRKAALTALINEGAEKRGVRIARNTLSEWLSGGRDPSVSSSDLQTRENIYRLCAALDLDMELTEELFEKVFFSRAFDLKVLKEFAFFYFARKDSLAGEPGCRWYATGEKVWQDVASRLQPEGDGEAPIRDTVLLADRTAVMDEAEFLRFLSSHPDTFLRENRFVRARGRIREYALRACRMTPELADLSCGEEIPYEALIHHILGYAQRRVGTAGTVASLRSLPPQLTTNFPTGQILRKICLGEACSYDQVYKMFSLLLFYCYHAKLPPGSRVEQRFNDFLRFANLSLEREGCTELYPRQPFGGLLLFCAVQEDPLAALRRFIDEAVRRESEETLLKRILAIPGLDRDTGLALIRCEERDPFLAELTASTLRRPHCRVTAETLIRAEYYDDRALEIIQRLYSGAGFSPEEKRLLACCALLPPDGVSEVLFRLLFPEGSLPAAEELAVQGWLSREKGNWSMHYRVRAVVTGQEVAGADARAFLDTAAGLDPDALSPKEARQLQKLLRHRKSGS